LILTEFAPGWVIGQHYLEVHPAGHDGGLDLFHFAKDYQAIDQQLWQRVRKSQ
jgi:hypothetical protein